jgi:hypothetical protein
MVDESIVTSLNRILQVVHDMKLFPQKIVRNLLNMPSFN